MAELAKRTQVHRMFARYINADRIHVPDDTNCECCIRVIVDHRYNYVYVGTMIQEDSDITTEVRSLLRNAT